MSLYAIKLRNDVIKTLQVISLRLEPIPSAVSNELMTTRALRFNKARTPRTKVPLIIVGTIV